MTDSIGQPGAALGYGGLIWARAKEKSPAVRVLSGLFGLALVAYLPATLLVCATAFS